MAEEIVSILKLSVSVEKVTEFDSRVYTSPRPMYEILKTTQNTRSWEEALREYVLEYKRSGNY